MPNRANVIALLCLLLVCLLVAATSIFAHDPGLSSLELRVEGDALTAQFSFARAELDPLAAAGLDALARQALDLRVDGEPRTPSKIDVLAENGGAVRFQLRYDAIGGRRLALRSALLAQLPLGHKQHLTIHASRGEALPSRMLDAKSSAWEFDLAAIRESGARPVDFAGFLKLGIEHILTGFDHLAFLFALLLAGGSLREAAKIITSFTLAHSLTLGLATFDLARVPAGIVEPLIAVSIVYVGVENLLRTERGHRWKLTFAFGLIHGFGFASALRELGIGGTGTGAILPLFSFNLGVEIGQVAIAALLLPLLAKWNRRPAFATRAVPACSLLIAAAGLFWLVERTVLK